MSWSLVIGLVVVVLGALGAFPLVFGSRPEPATVRAANGRATRARDQRGADGVSLRWYHRVRGIAGLLLVTLGLGAALAVVLGAVVLAIGAALGG